MGQGPVKVVAGPFVAGDGLAASEGSIVYLYVPSGGEYSLYSSYNLKEAITGLAAVRLNQQTAGAAAASAERITVLLYRQGGLVKAAESGRETGADFVDVAAGDLDGDGRDEIVAASAGQESIYVYRIAGEAAGALRLELVGIRAAPGTPRHVAVFKRPDGVNVIAVAYQSGDNWGVATYRLAEEGFEEGSALAAQPLAITAMAAGDFRDNAGEELALGMNGGDVWLVGGGPAPEVLLVTDSLGTLVSALASRGEKSTGLGAGTPGGNVFIFNYPVRRSPDLVFKTGEEVTGLAFTDGGGRAAVGTAAGELQVWSLEAQGAAYNYTVKPGDTLWSISLMTGIPVESILRANEGIITNPALIMPGQIIRIPAGNGS